MCIFKRPKVKTMAAAPQQSEEGAQEAVVGSRRQAEDESLYGGFGAPSLRVDRSASGGGVGAGGSGLKVM